MREMLDPSSAAGICIQFTGSTVPSSGGALNVERQVQISRANSSTPILGSRSGRDSNQRVEPFLIFAADRTGSTTLGHTLALHPNITCATEPFNTSGGGPFLTAGSQAELRSHLDLLYATFSGIKHVWFSDGWPFDDQSFHDIVLTHGMPRVIFLDRRNALQRAVSYHIACQTRIWHVNSARDPNRRQIASRQIAPIDVEWISSYIDGQRSCAERYRKELVASGVDWMDLSYEDLYNPTMGLAARLKTLDDIVSFLGATPIGREAQAMARLLNPKSSKMNSSSTYRLVPNVEEIEQLFGNAENGYLNDTAPITLSKPSIFAGIGVDATKNYSAPMPEADRIAVLEAQVTYLQRVAKQQSADLRHVEQQLSSTLVRLAGRIERVLGKTIGWLKPVHRARPLRARDWLKT